MKAFKTNKVQAKSKYSILITCLVSLSLGATEFQVSRTDDPLPNGCGEFDCSLREAVIAANNNPGLDTVILNLTEYFLSRSGQDDTADSGDLDVLDDLVVLGQFSSLVPLVISEINATNLQDRIFDVASGVTLNINNLVLQNADAGLQDGGAIKLSSAELNLNNTYFFLNQAESGGAIFANESTLNVLNSEFQVNTAAYTGGAMSLLRSHINMESSDIVENFAEIGGGVAVILFENDTAEPSIRFFDSRISSNYAESVGGGLYLSAGLAIEPSAIQIIEIEQSSIADNEAKRGAGIYHLSGDLNINSSNINENLAFNPNMSGNALGGGIYFGITSNLESMLRINHSLVYGNESISTHTLGKAAGVYIENHSAEITNTTFSQNVADSSAAIEIQSGNLELTHNTFAHNDTANGFDLIFSPASVTDLQNNIIVDRCLLSGFAVVNSLDGNIESPGDTCGLGSNDLYGTNRRNLISSNLLANGGPTLTHAINNYNSEAIGFAVPLQGIVDDQRLMPRDDQPDSGAYEVQPGDLNVIFKDGFE